jgi:hypothetical protein
VQNRHRGAPPGHVVVGAIIGDAALQNKGLGYNDAVKLLDATLKEEKTPTAR